MVNANKLLSLIVSLFLILSNIAIAQLSDSSSFEGKPIDPSREGIDYYREGDVIVYPHKMGSREKEMMERFNRGEFSEEEMRRMAKEKFGKDFNEMEFKKSMIEFEERMERKDTFSYEHEGYEGYDYGPSYEGYSKEHMIFGMIFEYIADDIDPREIKQYCKEPEKIADILISKLKESVGELQSICGKFAEMETKCEEHSKKACSQIGTAFVREDATEMEKINAIAYSCPVNNYAIVEACKKRSKFHLQQRIENADEECRKRFDFEGERLLRECERFKQDQICDREKYIERCIGRREEPRFDKGKGPGFSEAKWECHDGTVESQSDTSCRSSRAWEEMARKSCDGKCNRETGKCGVNSFSVSRECEEQKTCPEQPIPDCGEGHLLRKKVDSNGCGVYYCEREATVCPKDVKQCPDGSYVSREGPNCEFRACPNVECGTDADCKKGICPDGSTYRQYSCSNNKCITINYLQDPCHAKCPLPPPCPTQLIYGDPSPDDPNKCPRYQCPSTYCGGGSSDPNCICPEGHKKEINQQAVGPQTVYWCVKSVACSKPTCEGVYDTGQKDSNGCPIFGCPPACSAVTKPTCAAEERLETYYDNKGCISSYQCVKYQTCSTVQKPTCTEGQRMTTKYDDKGCVVGYECVTITTSDSSITGHATFSNENIKEQCEKSWTHQQRICSESQNVCDKESFIQKCKEHEKKNFDDFTVKMEKHCSAETMPEIKHAEQRCSRLEEDRQKCLEHSAKRCEHMKGLADKCKEFMTEENLRKFILEEAKKRCKFTDIIEDEEDVRKADKVEIILAVLNTATKDDVAKLKLFIDGLKEDLKLQDTTIYKGVIKPNSFGDIKLMPFVVNAKISTHVSSERSKEVKARIVARTKVEEAASKLVSLRNSDIPSEYLYIIEDKANDVLDAAGKLGEVEKKEEQKGFGYKIRLFLGLAKAAENEEIKQLEESKSKLQNSIETLTKLIDEVPSDVAKSILKEQVENLKQQREEIQVLVETKEKKSKGLFGVFG